jgi:ABC-type sugar transport system ATPase subunit
MEPFLEMHAISKRFPGVKALDKVDLLLYRGEVHVLAGENGAGKSTLMKVITGVYRSEPGGVLRVEGEEVIIRDPIHARSLGINIIYQELTVVDNLSIAENIFLAREPLRPSGFIDFAKMRVDAAKLLAQLDMKVDPATNVGSLSIGHKQMIEIARAISYRSKVIIMDEPTASLSDHEAQLLLGLVKRLAAQDIGIVYISHKLDEIFRIADRITVLRDGRTVDSRPIGEMTPDLLVRKMVERDLTGLFGEHHSHAKPEVMLSVKNLRQKKSASHSLPAAGVNFEIRKGEMVGFFGLIGAGRTELMEMIFGTRPALGEITIAGRPVKIKQPADAIRAGLGFVTEDRKSQGLVIGMTVRENFSLTHLADYCRLDFIDRKREQANCLDFIRRLDIKTPTTEQKVANLSGGNQQKVAIAKWLARKPRILIVDEPTRGIDIGAKSEVYALLNGLAEEGLAIIVVSSDLPEVLAITDRIIVFKEKRIVGNFRRGEANQEDVMHAATT